MGISGKRKNQMILWIRQLFCKHIWKYNYHNEDYYDSEEWYVCEKCGKEKETT